MKYLLDTHTMIWYFEGNSKLTDKTKTRLFNTENTIHIGSISLWEVAIKMNIGKYTYDGGFSAFKDLVEKYNFSVIPIKDRHMERLFSLPFHHKDPFDRLLVATAICENMTIITADEDIQKYDVPWMW